MIDTRLLFNRNVILETAPDGVAVAGKTYPVPARYVQGFVNSGVAQVAPDEAPLPPKTSISTKELVPDPKGGSDE